MSAQSVHDNERSYAIELISAINDHLHTARTCTSSGPAGKPTINEHGRASSLSTSCSSSDRQRARPSSVAGEIKCPDRQDRRRGAGRRRPPQGGTCWMQSMILWNFQHAELHAKTKGAFEIFPESWTISELSLADRASINAFQGEWMAFLHSLVDKIELFIASGKSSSGNWVRSSPTPSCPRSTKQRRRGQRTQEAASMPCIVSKGVHSSTRWTPIAPMRKMLLIGWLNKLLFANRQDLLSDAREVESITEGCTVEDAARCFASRKPLRFIKFLQQSPYSRLRCPTPPCPTSCSSTACFRCATLSSLIVPLSHRLLEESILGQATDLGQYPTPSLAASHGRTWREKRHRPRMGLLLRNGNDWQGPLGKEDEGSSR